MTKNIDSRKYELIREIIGLDNEEDISLIETQLQSMLQGSPLSTAIKPVRSAASVLDLIREQNYHPLSKEEFFQMTSGLEWEESLDELLEMLTP